MDEKRDKTVDDNIDPVENNSPKLGADVYENATKFNGRLAIIGPTILYTLGKLNEHAAFPNVATAAGGMVMGGVAFFGNRYFRNRGDNSAYSYMGMIQGGVQFTVGFLLTALQASETFADNGEPSKLLNVIKIAGVALVVTQTTLVLMNSYLYSDGPPKEAPSATKKHN